MICRNPTWKRTQHVLHTLCIQIHISNLHYSSLKSPETSRHTQTTNTHYNTQQITQAITGLTWFVSTSQFNLPDGWWFRSLHFQIIWLFLHLKFSENEGDGVPWICQDGPLTLATRAQTSSTSTCASDGGFPAREIKAGNEPTGTPQGAATCVLGCQSPNSKAARKRENRTVPGLFTIHSVSQNDGHTRSVKTRNLTFILRRRAMTMWFSYYII